jgi:transposase
MQSGVPTTVFTLKELGSMDKIIVGFDVAKDFIEIAVAGAPKVERIANTDQAITAWLAQVGARRIRLAAFEPTGGYERALRRGLRAAGIAFTRVHPNEVVAFRKRRGVKAKTDRLDARLIAAFAAEELSRRSRAANLDSDELLRELVARRRQLQAILHAERCRRNLAESAVVRAGFDTTITALEQAFAALEAAIAAHIADSPALHAAAARMQTLTGVGAVIAFTMLAELPELGHLTGKEIASLAGLAPRTRQSGKQIGDAGIGHGRPGVKITLFNGARAAIRFNPQMKAFYHRLVHDNRRPGKVALTAVMRKMLVTLNAMVRDGTDWHQAASAAA